MSDHCQTPSYIIRHSYLPPETEYEYKDLLLNDNGSDLIFFQKVRKAILEHTLSSYIDKILFSFNNK